MKKNAKIEDPISEALAPESDMEVKKYSSGLMVVAMAMAAYFSTIETVLDKIVFIDETTPDVVTQLKIETKEKPEKKPTPKKNQKRTKRSGSPSKKVGKGLKNAVPSRGVLRLLASKSDQAGKQAYSLLNDQNFAKDISKVLENVSGLKRQGRVEQGVNVTEISIKVTQQVALVELGI